MRTVASKVHHIVVLYSIITKFLLSTAISIGSHSSKYENIIHELDFFDPGRMDLLQKVHACASTHRRLYILWTRALLVAIWNSKACKLLGPIPFFLKWLLMIILDCPCSCVAPLHLPSRILTSVPQPCLKWLTGTHYAFTWFLRAWLCPNDIPDNFSWYFINCATHSQPALTMCTPVSASFVYTIS